MAKYTYWSKVIADKINWEPVWTGGCVALETKHLFYQRRRICAEHLKGKPTTETLRRMRLEKRILRLLNLKKGHKAEPSANF